MIDLPKNRKVTATEKSLFLKLIEKQNQFFFKLSRIYYLEPMDLGNVIYIVAVVGYFIYKAVSGKKAKELDDNDFPDQNTVPKPVSFEDLLKEIREAQSPKKEEEKPIIVQKSKPIAEEYQRPSPVAVKRFHVPEKVEMDDEAQFYQGSYNTATQSVTKLSEINYEESFLKVELDESSKKINRYAKLLKNPDTLRESLMVGEILKPKYF